MYVMVVTIRPQAWLTGIRRTYNPVWKGPPTRRFNSNGRGSYLRLHGLDNTKKT